MKFCLIYHIHLSSCQPTTTSSSILTTLCKGNASAISRMQKMLSKSSSNPKAWILKSLSHVQFFATPWTIAYQTPPYMGFSRQECWSGLPFPSPGDLLDPGIEPRSPALQADALLSEPPGKPHCKNKQTYFSLAKMC